MYNYLMKSDDEVRRPVSFKNPVSKGDEVYMQNPEGLGIRVYIVQKVMHFVNGSSTIMCMRIR